MCKQHALRIAWTIARSIAFLGFRVLRWKFTYDWKCVNTTYRVPLFCPLPASRKGLRLTLRSALFGEGGRDWRPCLTSPFKIRRIGCLVILNLDTHSRQMHIRRVARRSSGSLGFNIIMGIDARNPDSCACKRKRCRSVSLSEKFSYS